MDSSGVRRTVNAQLNALTGVVQALAAVAAGSTVAPVSPADTAAVNSKPLRFIQS
ncbi:hypothetical protein [Escherichia coli]|uniref:hypothetical protein n=1 Tax=Escherichia coli TaxID=562 RepID=UPI002019C00D|nr:hypothetical protein [Escherichia coli]